MYLQSSPYHILFPCVKVLKIHLIDHSANDFLQNLDAIFCKQIEELWWLTAYNDSNDRDMTNILAKFESLKSLHWAQSSGTWDLDQLYSVCPNLVKTEILPNDNNVSINSIQFIQSTTPKNPFPFEHNSFENNL